MYLIQEKSKNQKEEPIMHKKSKPVNIQRDADTSRFSKRIGSSLYKVSVYFSQDSKETIDDKILRLAKNDLNFTNKCATIKTLQMERLSGRSSA